jgi:hypothetical protein
MIAMGDAMAHMQIKARTYVGGTQLGMRSGPCWKC